MHVYGRKIILNVFGLRKTVISFLNVYEASAQTSNPDRWLDILKTS